MANDAAIKRVPLPRFDHGIERIVRTPVPRHDSTSAHQAGEFAPAFTATKPRLEQLFDMPNLDDYLGEVLAPQVSEGTLMLPHRFAAGLRAAQALLHREAGRLPRQARVLTQAGEVLAQQAALRELLQMYLSALYKG